MKGLIGILNYQMIINNIKDPTLRKELKQKLEAARMGGEQVVPPEEAARRAGEEPKKPPPVPYADS